MKVVSSTLPHNVYSVPFPLIVIMYAGKIFFNSASCSRLNSDNLRSKTQLSLFFKFTIKPYNSFFEMIIVLVIGLDVRH